MIILCDIDGTAANIDHRRHLVEKSKDGTRKADWLAFFDAMIHDTPNLWCKKLLQAMTHHGHQVIFVSGRPEDYRQETETWLDRHYFFTKPYHLFMRPEGDYRPDYEIKGIIYKDVLEPMKDDILFVLDDRKQVVDMWRNQGLTVLQCDEGDF